MGRVFVIGGVPPFRETAHIRCVRERGGAAKPHAWAASTKGGGGPFHKLCCPLANYFLSTKITINLSYLLLHFPISYQYTTIDLFPHIPNMILLTTCSKSLFKLHLYHSISLLSLLLILETYINYNPPFKIHYFLKYTSAM